MKIAFNIGWSGPLSSGILTYSPTLTEVESFSEIAQDLRTEDTIKRLFEYAEIGHAIPSAIAIWFAVEKHEFRIKMINVREYKAAWEQKYKTKWVTET